MQKTYRHPWGWLFAIAFIGVLLQSVRFWQYDSIQRDEIYYLRQDYLSRQGDIATTNFRDATIPPVLPWLLTLGKHWGFPTEYWGRFIMGAAAFVLPVALYFISFALWHNQMAALAAALLMATQPEYVRYGLAILRDGVYWALFMTAILIGIGAIRRHNYIKWLLFAFFSAFCFLTRKEGFELQLCVVAWGTVEIFRTVLGRKNHLDIGYILKVIGINITVFALITLPLLLYSTRIGSGWNLKFYGRMLQRLGF